MTWRDRKRGETSETGPINNEKTSEQTASLTGELVGDGGVPWSKPPGMWLGLVSFPPMRFRLIDQVLEQTDTRIVAVKNVSSAEEYLGDHFPTFPVLPGVFMLEALVQAARRLLGDDGRRFVLGGVKALRYGTFVKPGETLHLQVDLLKRSEDGVVTFKGGGVVLAPGAGLETADTAVSGRFTMRTIQTAPFLAAASIGDGSPAD
jgi:3-hydroxyacyl-[acyl-carrier-protein] dehydratase